MSRHISTDPLAIEFHYLNDPPPQCQVEWGYEKNTAVQCTNVAVWIGDCHDESDHDVQQILFCAECKIVAEYKRFCGCGVGLINNLRRL